MKLKNSVSALVLLVIIAIASGCVDGGTDSGVEISQTSGVNIESFTASPTEIYSGQPSTLELRLKNNGGQEARDVEAKLYNIPLEDDRSWNIASGEQTLEFNNLRPANPDTETPSREVSQVWTLEAPEIDSNQRIPYTVNTRIFYKYSTEGVTDIKVMTGQEFRESNDETSRPTLDNSGGPIQLEVRTRSPVVFYDDSESMQTNFCVIVSNEGSGTPFLSSADYSEATESKNQRKVKLNIQASGNQISFGQNEKTVEIIGKEGQTCFTMNAEGISGSEIQKTVPVTLEADYGYYLDSGESLTVRGRPN